MSKTNEELQISFKDVSNLSIHIEDGKRYLYLGRYPNKVVQNRRLIRKLKKVKPNDGIYKYDGEEYVLLQSKINKAGSLFEDVDIVWVNGKAKTQVITNDVYFSDGKRIKDKYEYFFKLDPIKWIVLGQCRDYISLQSDMIIDCKAFEEDTEMYEESLLRGWLNQEFYDVAFSGEEKEHILISENDNGILSNDVYDGTIRDLTGQTNIVRVNEMFQGRKSSKDFVFLPSFKDVHMEDYGFHFASADTKSRIKSSTDYALACGLTVGKNGRSSWWTRSSRYNNTRYIVTSTGSVMDTNINVKVIGVAPCIRIKTDIIELSTTQIISRNVTDGIVLSSITETTDTEKKEKQVLQVEQRYVCFGQYPQTVVDNQEILDKLRRKKGIVIKLDGSSFIKRANNTFNLKTVFSNENIVEKNRKYYFKFEPILWKIVRETNDFYVLVSHFLLDVMKYDEISTEYNHSEIRSKLNNQFLDFAFNEEEKLEMLPIYKDDLVTVPSSDFLQSNSNGYPHLSMESYTRMKRVTDFSKCAGIYETNYIFLHNGYSYWWVRNSMMKGSVQMVFDDGALGNRKPNMVGVGICPLIKVKKSKNMKILSTVNELKRLDDFFDQVNT